MDSLKLAYCWKTDAELTELIKSTRGSLLEHRQIVFDLEKYLAWLVSMKDHPENENIENDELNYNQEVLTKSLISPDGILCKNKRHLPTPPPTKQNLNRCASNTNSVSEEGQTESETSSLGRTDKQFSSSLDNLAQKSKSRRPKSMGYFQDKKFSTLDLSFLKRLKNKKKQFLDNRSQSHFSSSHSISEVSFSSTEDYLNEEFQSDAESLDALNTRSEGSSRAEEENGMVERGKRLHRNRAIYSKKKNTMKKRVCKPDRFTESYYRSSSHPAEKHSGTCDLLEEINNELKRTCSIGGTGDDMSLVSTDGVANSDSDGVVEEPVSHATTTSTNSSSSSTRSDLSRKRKSKGSKDSLRENLSGGLVRSKSGMVKHDDDNISQSSVIVEQNDERVLTIENFLMAEKCYISKLQMLVEQYEQPLREHSKHSLTLRHDINTIFHHPCHLLMIHKSFLIAAQHRLKKQHNFIIGDLFLEMVNQFRVYEDFAKDFSYVMETLARIQSQELDVNNIMLSVQATCGLSLVDLFHIPIPQSETYLDVMRTVRSLTPQAHPDSIILEDAELSVEEVMKNVDRIMCDMRKRAKSYKKRELVYKGIMAGQNEKGVLKMRYMFLYNDVLICARMPSTTDRTSMYIPKWHMPLSELLLSLTHGPDKVIETIEQKQLKNKIKESQRLLKEEECSLQVELGKGVTKRIRGFKKQRVKVIKESIRDKMEEYQIMHMVVPLKLISKRGKTYTMHLLSTEERQLWMTQIQEQLNKLPACTSNAGLSNVEVESMLQRYTKLRKTSTVGLELDTEEEIIYDGVLLVQVICGSDVGEPGAKPDTYVTLECDSNGVLCKKTKTKVVKASTTPNFDETLCIQAVCCQFLKVVAYSKKQFQKPTLIGSKLINLPQHKLEDNKPHALVLNLTPKGQLKLTVQLLSLEMARQRKESQHQTFGVSLDELALIEGQKIPPIIHSCFKEIESRGVQEVGIYRVNGVDSEIRRLKSAFDESADNGAVLTEEAEINAVAGVVKQFFRQLPKPLFPEDMYLTFCGLVNKDDVEAKEAALSLFSEVPEPNISVIVRLVEHLNLIAEQKVCNKMDVNNLCTVFGPNVVKPPATLRNGSCNVEEITTDIMQQVNILKFFCDRPLRQLKDLQGDDDCLRPRLLSPESEKILDRIGPIKRVISKCHLNIDTSIIVEEDYSDSFGSDPLSSFSKLSDSHATTLCNINGEESKVTSDSGRGSIDEVSEEVEEVSHQLDSTVISEVCHHKRQATL